MSRRVADNLTRREHEVLSLVRLGLTNEEIAGRLEISVAGAKYHVSQILSKLGVSTREDAAAVALAEQRAWWLRAALWAKIAGAATVAAAVVGLAVLAWGVVRTEGDDVSVPAVVAATPIPWVGSAPGPTSSPTPFPSADPRDLAVPACGAQDVKGEIIGGNGAGGWIFIHLAFSDLSTEPCRLEGVPAILLLDASGDPLPTDWHEDPCLPGGTACARSVAILRPDHGETPVPNYRLTPGQAGVTLMYWGRVQELPSYTPCPSLASAIAFELPENGGRVVVPLAESMNACVALSVSQFLAAPTSTPAPDPGAALIARLDLPETVTAGESLEFVVDITNNSGTSAFVFGELCPEYTIILGTKQAQSWHSLNCQPANSIPARGTVAFAMELAVPAELPPGSYAVDWTLNGGRYVVTAGTDGVTEKTPYFVEVVAP